jgi:hypothetical protein
MAVEGLSKISLLGGVWNHMFSGMTQKQIIKTGEYAWMTPIGPYPPERLACSLYFADILEPHP